MRSYGRVFDEDSIRFLLEGESFKGREPFSEQREDLIFDPLRKTLLPD